MENPNTWTLLHHDLARASKRIFSSTEKKAEALQIVLENHRIASTKEEIVATIEAYVESLENGRCGKSLIATIVDTFSNKIL